MTAKKRTILFFLFLFLCAGLAFPFSSEKRIVRVPVQTRQQIQTLHESFDVAALPDAHHVDLVVNDQEESILRARGFHFFPLPLEAPPLRKTAVDSSVMGLYHSYAEMINELEQIAQQCPHIAQLQVIGYTVENRKIYAIKISDNPQLEETYEPSVLYVGNIHAREIITPEIILYFLHYLIDNYGIDERVTSIVDNRQLWLVPTINPDGHVHVETVDVWWRKNRRLNADSSYGVDLNRNFSYHWGYDDFGSSPVPFDETFRGLSAFSEPESRTIRDLVCSHRFISAIFYHSYGRSWLFPWSSEYRETPHHALFLEMSRHMTKANDYIIGNVSTGAIYIVNGDTDDYLYGNVQEKNRIFPFSPEIGNTFRQREASILRLVDENLPANLYLAEISGLLEQDPARVFAPAAPMLHASIVDDDGRLTLSWQSAADEINQARAFRIQQFYDFAMRGDNAEESSMVLEYENFQRSPYHHWNGFYSYYSATRNPIRSNLSWRIPITVTAGQVFSFKAWYDLEPNFDYFYVQVSQDQGKTYANLAGSHTRWENPYGRNIGNGITGSSNGWQTLSFDLRAYIGEQILLRIRHITEGLDYYPGLFIDDICPLYLPGQEVNRTVSDSSSVVIRLQKPGWYGFRVAGIDGDEQQGDWSPMKMVQVDFGLPADVNRDAVIDDQDWQRCMDLALQKGAAAACGELWRADLVASLNDNEVRVDVLDATALSGLLHSAPPDSDKRADFISVSLAEAVAQPGQKITVPVYLNTRQPVAGLQWELEDQCHAVSLDSISSENAFADFKFLHYQNRILIAGPQNQLLPVGEYKLCELSLTVSASINTDVDTLFFKEPVMAVSRNGRQANWATWNSAQITLTRTRTDHGDAQSPDCYALEQNYPNPFNQETVFRFSLRKSGPVTLTLYDRVGREIKTLLQGFYTPGSHEFRWHADHLASGTYFVRLRANDYSITRKILLLK